MSLFKRRCRWCGGPHVADGSVPARVLGVLEADPRQWWTTRQLADRANANVETVARVMAGLKAADLVFATRTSRGGPFRYARKDRARAVDRSWPPTVTQGFLCSCGVFLPDPHRLGFEHVVPAHRDDHVNPDAARRVS